MNLIDTKAIDDATCKRLAEALFDWCQSDAPFVRGPPLDLVRESRQKITSELQRLLATNGDKVAQPDAKQAVGADGAGASTGLQGKRTTRVADCKSVQPGSTPGRASIKTADSDGEESGH